MSQEGVKNNLATFFKLGDDVVGWSAADELAQAIGPSLHSRRLLRVGAVAVIDLRDSSLGMVEKLADN